MSTIKIKTTKNYSSKKLPPKRISQTYLHNSGLYYLQRYSSSVENFRRVFKRKIIKSCSFHTDQNPEECLELLEGIIENFVRSNLLNDETYAYGKISSLRRIGQSKQSVVQKMQMKGINSELIDQTLQKIDGQNENSEFDAALIFAKRKKIGPFASANKEVHHTKQLAMMARAGFSYDISTKILKLNPDEI